MSYPRAISMVMGYISALVIKSNNNFHAINDKKRNETKKKCYIFLSPVFVNPYSDASFSIIEYA